MEHQKEKKSSAAAKKSKKSHKKRKKEDSDSSVVESSKELTEACHPSKKYYIFQGKCSNFTYSCKDLRAMINKFKHKKKF